jgi:hypothetical protein
VRLVLWNIGGGVPGVTDMATQGQPAKYLFCAAENAGQSPWQPLHVERGLAAEQSAVTVFACQSPTPLRVLGDANRILRLISSSLPVPAVNMFHAAGQFLLSFGARPAHELARAGYSKADVKQWVWENARFHVGRLRESGVIADEAHMRYWGHGEPSAPDISTLSDDTLLPMVSSVDMIHVAVIGGDSQWWMGFSAGWGNYGGYAVTKPIEQRR